MRQVPTPYTGDEIDLRTLLVCIWKGKWIILLLTVTLAALGIFYALSLPNVYRASTMVAPAQSEGGGRIGGQLSSLASLAGVSVGGGKIDKTVIAKETLQSRAFLTEFIHRHGLMVPLMAAKAWNMKAREWVIDDRVYDSAIGEWRVDSDQVSLQPTDWDLVKKFREQLSVTENPDNGMLAVSITSLSPDAAKDWVGKLIEDINEHMRTQDVQDAEASIAYLEDKLRQTNIAGMQQVFYQLIETETRTVMLASAKQEYVFKTVDPPVVPQEKSEPNRALIAIAATLLGLMLGIFTVLILAFVHSGKDFKSSSDPKDSK